MQIQPLFKVSIYQRVGIGGSNLIFQRWLLWTNLETNEKGRPCWIIRLILSLHLYWVAPRQTHGLFSRLTPATLRAGALKTTSSSRSPNYRSTSRIWSPSQRTMYRSVQYRCIGQYSTAVQVSTVQMYRSVQYSCTEEVRKWVKHFHMQVYTVKFTVLKKGTLHFESVLIGFKQYKRNTIKINKML